MEIYIAKSGRESGPYNQEQIQPMLDSGMLELTDSVWHKELPNWIPVHQFLEIRPPVPVAPPLPPPPPPTLPATQKTKVASGDPAPFLRRLVAHLIDLSLLVPLSAICMMLLLAPVVALGKDSVIGMVLSVVPFVVGLVIPTWIYHAWSECSVRQASLGKMACGLIVTDLEGHRIEFKQASRRAMSKAISNLFFFGAIFLTCLFTGRRQCIHDIHSDCLVVVK